MKKIIAALTICGVLITSNVFAQNGVHLFIDGQEKKADVVLKNDRTFVPIRFISESMNYKVDYDEATKGIKISKGNETMDLTVGSKKFVKDGREDEMDVEAFINNDRTFVPLRFIGEAFSKEVGWHQDSKSVYIGEKPAEFPKPATNGYQVKEFPKYGFKLFVPNNFDDKILIRDSEEGNGIEFHSKFVDNYRKNEGFLRSLSLVKDDTTYEEWMGIKRIIEEDGKMILQHPSLDFFQSSGKYYDDMMKCFDIMDKVIVTPLGNVFPSAKNSLASVENGNFVYKFGNPQVAATIPINKLKGIRLTVGANSLEFNDIKNENIEMGGHILTLTQNRNGFKASENLSGYILLKQGKSITEIVGPTDVQYDDKKEFSDSYNKNKKILIESLNIKIGDKNYKIKNF